MFKKVLIANRGEVALRVIYACRELGIKTVVAHSQADEHSLAVRFADEEVCIGPARSLDSYLSVPAIITAAEITGADAIHPGYGFLSESAYLAEACDACRITFIGPPADVLRLLGDKSHARRAMQKAGLPVVPGTESLEGVTAARRAARRLGYPVIIKATSGGGGRGMRVVRTPHELEDAFPTACREAGAAFGDPRVYLETYLEEPRHIEFQVLADVHGATVHLGGSARCSGGIRRCSRRRPRSRSASASGTRWGGVRRRRRGRSGMSTPGRSSFCWMRGAASTSWRRTPGFRWSIRSPRW